MNNNHNSSHEQTSQGQTLQDVPVTIPFSSNTIRLSMRDWGIATSLVLLVMIVTPIAWRRAEPFDSSVDFRVPYEVSDDYWMYQRLVDQSIRDQRILVIGDSVVWGEYVDRRHTLQHNLDALPGADRFANGGLNGTHPLALQGLVQYYAGHVKDQRVVLHCNLLWMSSPERDLQTEKEMAFNHPRLVPQFVPALPCYKATAADRLGIAIDRHIPFRTWVNHLRVAKFDGLDVPRWTLENPYHNLLDRLSPNLRQSNDGPHSPPIPWTERGMQPQDIPWLHLDASLQWSAFRATVELLRDRGNSVYVIVGPFNEHLLTDDSRQRYLAMKRQAEIWLDASKIAFYAPPPLPSDEYGDASHPLAAGYRRLAQALSEQTNFQSWLHGGQ